MPQDKLQLNTFTSYALDIKEAHQGAVLSELQIMVVRNRMAIIAEQKIRLEYDPDNPGTFVQQEARLRGQLDAYECIILDSQTANTLLNDPSYQQP